MIFLLFSCAVITHVQATEEDYEKVPIEQFGLALLRGMGWKDGDGIGRTQRYLSCFVVN